MRVFCALGIALTVLVHSIAYTIGVPATRINFRVLPQYGYHYKGPDNKAYLLEGWKTLFKNKDGYTVGWDHANSQGPYYALCDSDGRPFVIDGESYRKPITQEDFSTYKIAGWSPPVRPEEWSESSAPESVPKRSRLT